jgi:hypothetical protein
MEHSSVICLEVEVSGSYDRTAAQSRLRGNCTESDCAPIFASTQCRSSGLLERARTAQYRIRAWALWDDHLPITAVEIGALDRAVVEIGNAHVGPLDVASLRIDDDTVREMATGNDGLAVGSVRIY